MELVIDSNIVFSAIISSKGKTRHLLFSDKIGLFAPEFLFDEFEKHRQEILAKSKLSAQDFELAFSIISSRIRFIPFADFKQFIQKAKKSCPGYPKALGSPFPYPCFINPFLQFLVQGLSVDCNLGGKGAAR